MAFLLYNLATAAMDMNTSVVREEKVFSQPRPTFTEGALIEEQNVNTLISGLLVKNGSQTAVELFQSMEEQDRPSSFKTPSDLDDFIQKRSHMFKYSPVSGKVSNRGFGYMRGIILMVTFVHDKNQNGSCSLADLFNIASKLPHYNLDIPWKDKYCFVEAPKNEEDLCHLLKRDHESVFTITEDRVTLNEDVRKMCSYWNSKGLVKLPDFQATVETENKKAKVTHIDKSRSHSFYVYIVSRTDAYMKGIIESGTFVNRWVYILGKNVGLTNAEGLSEIPDEYAIGTRALVTATYSLNTAAHFAATSIIPAGNPPDVWSENIKESFNQVFHKQLQL